MLTKEALHDEALTRFAALTRHKDNPQSLVPPFFVRVDPLTLKPGEQIMSLHFGKRVYEFKYAADDLDLTIQEFGDKHLAAAAQALLDSKG